MPYVSKRRGSTHAVAGLARGGKYACSSSLLAEHHPPSLARVHVFPHLADLVAGHREHEAIVIRVTRSPGKCSAHPLLHDHDIVVGIDAAKADIDPGEHPVHLLR